MKRTPCAPPQRLEVGVRVRKNGSVTEATALHDICDDEAVDAERSNRHGSYPRAGLAILALALGGFAIGTTEFVTMGLLQYLTPALQMAWGVFVGHEPMPAGRWTGFVLIWVALAVFTGDAVFRARVAADGRATRDAIRA